jgi:hypothetical protein
LPCLAQRPALDQPQPPTARVNEEPHKKHEEPNEERDASAQLGGKIVQVLEIQQKGSAISLTSINSRRKPRKTGGFSILSGYNLGGAANSPANPNFCN